MKSLSAILILSFFSIGYISCEKTIPVPDEENYDLIGLTNEPVQITDSLKTIVVDSLEIIECPEPYPYAENPDPVFKFFSDTNDVSISETGSFQIDNILTSSLPLKIELPSPINTISDEYFICQIRENSYQSGFLMGGLSISHKDLELLKARNLNWFYVKSNFITAGIHFEIQ